MSIHFIYSTVQNQCPSDTVERPLSEQHSYTTDTELSSTKHYFRSSSFCLTCWCVCKGSSVVAQLLSLLAPAVDPDAEAHEDDPASTPDACDECRLLDHISDLLGQTHATLFAAVNGSIAAFCAWRCRMLGWWLWAKKQKETGQKKQKNRSQKFS